MAFTNFYRQLSVPLPKFMAGKSGVSVVVHGPGISSYPAGELVGQFTNLTVDKTLSSGLATLKVVLPTTFAYPVGTKLKAIVSYQTYSSGFIDATVTADATGQLFYSSFDLPVVLSAASGNSSTNQYLSAGSFPISRWNSTTSGDSNVYCFVGTNNAAAASTYAQASIKAVTSRNNTGVSALSLALKATATALSTHNEYATLQQLQSQGTAGTTGAGENVRVEPVFYQKFYVKFDTNTLARAQAIGSSTFYQSFWEVRADPDYRIRVQLKYNGTSLYWHTQADNISNSTPIWQSSLTSLPVVLSASNQTTGWYKVEIYVNRPGNTFKVAINDAILISRSGTSLSGASGTILNQVRLCETFSDVTTSTATIWSSNLGPIEHLFTELELWDSPPSSSILV